MDGSDTWWRHQMETFSALLATCAVNSPVTGDFPAQRPVARSFDFFICVWINGWVNNREAGDQRHYHAHYDVTVMTSDIFTRSSNVWLVHKSDMSLSSITLSPLRWRHNDHAGVSNHQPHGCLLNRLFRRKSKKTSKLRVTGLCAGNSPGTGDFPAQMASYAENVSIWWRHHDYIYVHMTCTKHDLVTVIYSFL